MDIQKIIAKVFNDNASVEELEILESWKKESEANVIELEKMMKIHKASSDMKGYKAHDVDVAWDKLDSKIESSQQEVPKRKVVMHRYAIGIAATLLLICSAYFFTRNVETVPTEYLTSETQQSITLPDGSTVILDHFSKIVISEEFENTRNLSLEGRAFFSVIHKDDSRPFNINIPNAQITVLGTEFSVATDGDDSEVSVASGRVKVESSENRNIILTDGDLLLLEDNIFIKAENNSSNYFSWTDHNIVFKDTPILKILNELEWIYDTQIDASVIKQNATCRLSTSYNDMSIGEILEELKQQIDLDYTYKDDNIIVNDINCS
ncbi:MAG: FecR family protein [Saprospiraceae bacterium]|nr:FecR family protein [Saprospiraceae bacterium]